MTIQQAEECVRAYQSLLNENATRGARRNPSLLPGGKDYILSAIKLLIAQLYYLHSDTKEHLDPLIEAAMFIDSFNEMPLNATLFISSMQNRREEVEAFRQELVGIPRSDQFFWQRIYPLAGISFETKRNTFFESLKSRLQGRGKRESTTTFRRRTQVGRLQID